MRPSHGLASLIWAAIFLIAAQFVAASAFAHAGHSHHHLAASPTSAVHEPHKAESTSNSQIAVEDEKAFVTSQRGDHSGPTNPSGCTGGCCGNGIGCCGAAIAAVSGSLPDFRVQQSPTLLTSHIGSGIDPETLRRPPRTLA